MIIFKKVTQLHLTAHNWQKWKSIFLTCPCYEIYRVETVDLKKQKQNKNKQKQKQNKNKNKSKNKNKNEHKHKNKNKKPANYT